MVLIIVFLMPELPMGWDASIQRSGIRAVTANQRKKP